MNDAELDRLLDAWEAPEPRPSMREGLRARFPRVEQRRLTRPLRWPFVLAGMSALLAVAIAQTRGEWDFPLARVLNRVYESLLDGLEARQAAGIVTKIRQCAPKVYVDGQLAAPLEYAPAARMDVQVPGEGAYSVIVYSRISPRGGWAEAGRIRGSVIEFQAGTKKVRIECDKPITDSDRPVFVRRRP